MVRDSEEWWKEGVAWLTECGVAIGREGVGLRECEGLESVSDGATGREGEMSLGKENFGRWEDLGAPGATSCRQALMRA